SIRARRMPADSSPHAMRPGLFCPAAKKGRVTTKMQSTASRAETRAAAEEPAGPIPQPLVLLVDDLPARLLAYEAMLDGLGVGCVKASSGAKALERVLEQPFAVILLDVHMPEMDGFEVARLPMAPEVLRSKVAVLVAMQQKRQELEALNRALEAARRQVVAEQ